MLEILSRVQFALTVGFHFLFVPMSLGISFLMAIFELKHFRTKDDRFRKLADYYCNIFIVIYAIGIVTGIAMSIQFGTNWGEFSKFMGDTFGTPLALEALVALFLESTFTGILIFRRHKISPRFRLLTVLLVLFATSASSLWIITANAFMQHPVGYMLTADKTKIILNDISAVLLNPYMFQMVFHTLISAFLLGSFFVLTITSYRLLKTNICDEEKSIHALAAKTAAKVGLVAAILMPISGERFMLFLQKVNPSKFQIFIGNYSGYVAETEKLVQSSGIAAEPMRQSLANALNISFLLMVSLGTFFIIFLFFTLVLHHKYLESRFMQKIYLYTISTPYIAILAGWFIAESGRQPWTIYGLLPTNQAYSHVPVSVVWFSIILTCSLYLILFVVIFYLAKQQADKNLLNIKYTYVKGDK